MTYDDVILTGCVRKFWMMPISARKLAKCSRLTSWDNNCLTWECQNDIFDMICHVIVTLLTHRNVSLTPFSAINNTISTFSYLFLWWQIIIINLYIISDMCQLDIYDTKVSIWRSLTTIRLAFAMFKLLRFSSNSALLFLFSLLFNKNAIKTATITIKTTPPATGPVKNEFSTKFQVTRVTHRRCTLWESVHLGDLQRCCRRR